MDYDYLGHILQCCDNISHGSCKFIRFSMAILCCVKIADFSLEANFGPVSFFMQQSLPNNLTDSDGRLWKDRQILLGKYHYRLIITNSSGPFNCHIRVCVDPFLTMDLAI